MRMLGILFFIFFIIPFALRVLMRFFFGNYSQGNRSSQSNSNTSASSSSSSNMKQPPKKKKVILKNEGEYVDYEVIKD